LRMTYHGGSRRLRVYSGRLPVGRRPATTSLACAAAAGTGGRVHDTRPITPPVPGPPADRPLPSPTLTALAGRDPLRQLPPPGRMAPSGHGGAVLYRPVPGSYACGGARAGDGDGAKRGGQPAPWWGAVSGPTWHWAADCVVRRRGSWSLLECAIRRRQARAAQLN